jgi:hypothetical protein
MRNYMNNSRIGLLVLFSIVLGSCNLVRPFFIKNTKKEERKEKRVERKNERKSVRGNLVTVVIDSSGLAKKDSLKISPSDTSYARKIIDLKRINYNTFQCKAKMHIESGDNKQSFAANFRMQKDKVIWVSINAPLIGEVARAIITPDSVKAIERINKKSYLYSYSDIQKIINIEVDFNTLQELIIGNAMSTNGAITEIKELGATSTIFIKGNDYSNQLTYNKSDSTLRQLQLQTVRAVSTSSILIAYTQYLLQDARYFPAMRSYHIQDVKGAAELTMDINKFDFDHVIEFPFSIPASYKLQK